MSFLYVLLTVIAIAVSIVALSIVIEGVQWLRNYLKERGSHE